MPRIREVAPGLAKTARTEGWDPLELLVKVLAAEAAPVKHMEARAASARRGLLRQRPSTMFDFADQRSVSRAQIAHLNKLDFVREAHNVIFRMSVPGRSLSRVGVTRSQPFM